MTALGDFTAGQVLTAADLNAIGDWTDFTPTWNNVTVGDGTVTARYCKINRIVFYQVELVFGSTTAFTGTVQLYYPVAADGSFTGAVGGQVFCDDASSGDYFGGFYRSSTERATIVALNATATYVTYTNVNATTPFTWTTGDRLVIEDWYRSAT